MLEFQEKDGKLVCVFKGALNTEACWEVEKELYAKIGAGGQAVIFDLQGVDFVASAFLRICLTAYKKVGGDNFYIVNLRPGVKRVFKISGFDQGLNIVD